jgi:predicted membrane channel-forming protein YqfA (hemolysin III family)
MRSLFLLHNETINIWSHLLGFAFFAALFVRDLVLVIPAVTDDGKTIITKTDFLVLLILLICYQVCYFELFKQLNEKYMLIK